MAGPPFERYPGPPWRDAALFRVISPWRDALAWISIAGPLTIARYLVREGEGWRDALAAGSARDAGEPVWALEGRDPVEVVFRSVAGAPVTATASVTVSREACEVRVAPAIPEGVLRTVVDVRGEVVRDGDGWRIVVWPE